MEFNLNRKNNYHVFAYYTIVLLVVKVVISLYKYFQISNFT